MDLHIILGLTFLYFLTILGFVVYARFKATRSLLPEISEFFLASKNLHPAVLTSTYVASLFSTFSILGIPALMYAHGVSGLYFIVLLDAIALPIFYVIGKRLHRAAQNEKLFSPLEIISKAYNSRMLGFILAAVFTLALMPYIALQLVGVGAFIDAYSGGKINYETGVGSMMVIVLLYLFLGGMRAVAYTDFIQLIAMLFGLFCGAVFLTNHYDINLAQMLGDFKTATPAHLSMPGAKDHFYWPMIISMVVVTAGIFIQPHLLTRAIMAEKESHIKHMIFGTIGARLIILGLAFFFGVFAYQTYGTDLKPNLVMGEIFKDLGVLGPIGLVLSVLMLMGALGAAMSTADSLLISIGQITTRDMLRPFFKITQHKQVIISKGIMFLILLAAFFIGRKPPHYMTDLAVYSGAISAILIPIFLSFTWEKRSKFAALASIIIGAAALAVLTILKLHSDIAIKSVHIGFLPTLLAFFSYYALCYLPRKKTAEISA